MVLFASDDKISFDFYIKANQANNYSSLRYRQTTNVYNDWKVDLRDSGECKGSNDGCITTFWLEHNDGANVSPTVGTSEEDRVRYTNAFSSASKSDVRLTAENNNNVNDTYQIKGVWDEETD